MCEAPNCFTIICGSPATYKSSLLNLSYFDWAICFLSVSLTNTTVTMYECWAPVSNDNNNFSVPPFWGSHISQLLITLGSGLWTCQSMCVFLVIISYNKGKHVCLQVCLCTLAVIWAWGNPWSRNQFKCPQLSHASPSFLQLICIKSLSLPVQPCVLQHGSH